MQNTNSSALDRAYELGPDQPGANDKPPRSITGHELRDFRLAAWRPRGDLVLYKAMGEQTNNAYALRVVTGRAEPKHTHEHEDEFICLIDVLGCAEFSLKVADNEPESVQPASILFMPKGMPHATTCSSGSNANVSRIAVSSPTGPIGLEGYLEETADSFRTGASSPGMVRAQLKHGIRYAGTEYLGPDGSMDSARAARGVGRLQYGLSNGRCSVSVHTVISEHGLGIDDLRRHDTYDIGAYILAGAVTITVGDQELKSRGRDQFVFMPRGVPRSINADHGNAKVMIVSSDPERSHS